MPPTTAAKSPTPARRVGRSERTLESVERDTIRRLGTRWVNRNPDLPTGAKIVWQAIAEMTLGYRKEEDHLSHAVIADMSGIQARSVSRALHALEKAGAIAYRKGYTDPATGRMVPSWVKVLRPWESQLDDALGEAGEACNVVPLHPSGKVSNSPVSSDTRSDTDVTLPPSDVTGTPRQARQDPPVRTDGAPPVRPDTLPTSSTHEEDHEGDPREGGAASPRRGGTSASNRKVARSHESATHSPSAPDRSKVKGTEVERADAQASTPDGVVFDFLNGAACAVRADGSVPPVLPPMGQQSIDVTRAVSMALEQGATPAHVAVALAGSMIREKGSERFDGWVSCKWLLDRLGTPRVTLTVTAIGNVPVADAAEAALLHFAAERAGRPSSATGKTRALDAWVAQGEDE